MEFYKGKKCTNTKMQKKNKVFVNKYKDPDQVVKVKAESRLDWFQYLKENDWKYRITGMAGYLHYIITGNPTLPHTVSYFKTIDKVWFSLCILD